MPPGNQSRGIIVSTIASVSSLQLKPEVSLVLVEHVPDCSPPDFLVGHENSSFWHTVVYQQIMGREEGQIGHQDLHKDLML